jgi:WhiB family redox-sensing transcriptional regulator
MRLFLQDADPVRRLQWQEQAACQGYGSDLFFEPDNELRVVRARREQAAKKVCAECPVRSECLNFAESGPEVFGVWGGTTQRERAIRRRRRRRATSAPPNRAGALAGSRLNP